MIVRLSKYALKGLTGRKSHVMETSNASRTSLMNIKVLQWDRVLLKLFHIRLPSLPEIVYFPQVYERVGHGPLKGVKVGGKISDQQGALVGNKRFRQGEARCTFGIGAFLLFNSGNDIVESGYGLLGTVGSSAS
jgi:glycerol kinase